jgi:hypothetical protein
MGVLEMVGVGMGLSLVLLGGLVFLLVVLGSLWLLSSED